MSDLPVIPNKNPADDGSLGGTLASVIHKKLQEAQGQLPAIVLNYDRATNRATVRPLITVLKTNGGMVQRASIASVPVLALGGGGFTMTFPLVRGSMGWIEASDRDISLFMQSMQESKPNLLRIHSFEDGRFIPDAFAAYTFDSADAGSMVIQSYDGSVKIALRPGALSFKAPAIDMTATGLLALTGGTVTINQTDTSGATGATFEGKPVVLPDAVINGVLQSTHAHGGVERGEGVTDGPQGAA